MAGNSFLHNDNFYCENHTNEELRYYCVSCRTNVCSDCIIDRHPSNAHEVKKLPKPGSKTKEVRFHEPKEPDSKYKADTELIEILNEIDKCRRKTNDVAEAVSAAINNRAEELLRHIKKTRNQLQEECNTITKQNHMHLNALEKRIQMQLDNSPEDEISTMFQHIILKNAENKANRFRKNDTNSHNVTHPEIDIPVFLPGNVEMMRSIFGNVSVQQNDTYDYHRHQALETENLQPNTISSNENVRYNRVLEQRDEIFAPHHESKTQRKMFISQLKEQQKRLGYKDSSELDIQADRDRFEHPEHLDVDIKENKTQAFKTEEHSFNATKYSITENINEHRKNETLTNPYNGYTETSDRSTPRPDYLLLHQSPKKVSPRSVDQISPRLDFHHADLKQISPRSDFHCVLHFSIACEQKPVCSLCVVGLHACWIHQSISTTNSLLYTMANKRKKIDFKFVVEDWTLKPPDTLVIVDFNNRIVKLTPLGPSQNPLTATQNIGWSFHHVDLHPTAITFCKNGDFLVSLVDNRSYKIDKDSRRQVVRMNVNIEVIQTLEFFGLKRIFTLPRRISENTNGDICVLDEINENRGQILIFNRNGTVKYVYTGQSNGEKTFDPNGLCCDSFSRIIISDYTGNKLHVLNENGTFLQYIIRSEIINPYSLAIDSDDRLWLGLQSGEILVLSLQQ